MSPPPCSSASQLLLRGLTSRARASSATAPHLPDADRRPLTERSNASSPGSQRQGASAHARFYDHAGPYGHSRCRAHTYCLPPAERRRRPSCRSFAAQWLACAYPYRRFACTLAGTRARLGADAVRYSFIVADFHRLLLAGFTGALRSTSTYGHAEDRHPQCRLRAKDRDRGTPHGATPPTPPGIRVTYLGGSTGLSFNAQRKCEAGRESRKRDCAVPSEVPGVLTCARSPLANQPRPRQGILERLDGATP